MLFDNTTGVPDRFVSDILETLSGLVDGDSSCKSGFSTSAETTEKMPKSTDPVLCISSGLVLDLTVS